MTQMGFDEAMERMRAGRSIRRASWAEAPHDRVMMRAGFPTVCSSLDGEDWEFFAFLPAAHDYDAADWLVID